MHIMDVCDPIISGFLLWPISTRISPQFNLVAHLTILHDHRKIVLAHLNILPAYLEILPAHLKILPAQLEILSDHP